MNSAIKFIEEKTGGLKPDTALILGSGLGDYTTGMEGITIPYSEIDGFPVSSVKGHKGSLFFTEKFGKTVVVMQGRVHYYEGYSMEQVTFPVKLFKKIGVQKLIITNAAGSLDKELPPGDLMLIKDHINFMGSNPLIGKNDDLTGERFPDMSEIYDKKLRELALLCAKENNIPLHEGVYVGTTGPSYETPSEVKMLKILGGNVVGMSTVPEAIVANWAGMNVLGLSLVTNFASGISGKKLSHNEVIEAGKTASFKIVTLLNSILEEI